MSAFIGVFLGIAAYDLMKMGAARLIRKLKEKGLW